MVQFLFDCYCYLNLPKAIPIYIYACFVFLSFILLQYFGLYRGLLAVSILYIICNRISQPTLFWRNRNDNGIAWGIIFSLLMNYLFFIEIISDPIWQYVVLSTVFLTVISLYKCSNIVPGHLPKNKSMQLRLVFSSFLRYFILFLISIFESSILKIDLIIFFSNFQKIIFFYRTKLVNGIIIQGKFDGLGASSIEDLNQHRKFDVYSPSVVSSPRASSRSSSKFELSPNHSGSLRSRRRSLDAKDLNDLLDAVDDDDDDDDDDLDGTCGAGDKGYLLHTNRTIQFDESLIDQEGESDEEEEPDWSQVKPEKLCTTCMVDRTNANSHCIICDKCMVDLDHHCVFTNNCVGPGNRRWFLSFTFFATVASLAVFGLGIHVENSVYCADAQGIVSSHRFCFEYFFETILIFPLCALYFSSLCLFYHCFSIFSI